MKVLILSPYHGGSHKAWAEGYQRYSRHDVSLLTLPDRFWKWRMHGGAVTLARLYLEKNLAPDLILATDMLDLTTFLALTRGQTTAVPVCLYMHENQLTYPLPADGRAGPMRRQKGERDLHYAFVNYASMLAADAVWFNSEFHRRSWFTAVRRFLKHFPEFNELSSVDRLRQKSSVMPVGVDFARLEMADAPPATDAPLILWNQRWEYDKNPEAFFAALYVAEAAGLDFRVALCGQQYGKRPSTFDEARQRLGPHLVHDGHVDLPAYRRWLWGADITLSTAHHEFFGISILEAIYCRTFPILPQRLSYPELIPRPYHAACLYADADGLNQRLQWALTHPAQRQEMAASLATAVVPYHWANIAARYDADLSQLL